MNGKGVREPGPVVVEVTFKDGKPILPTHAAGFADEYAVYLAPTLLGNPALGLFGLPERPAVCGSLVPAADMCGDGREHAMAWLTRLERATQPV